MQTYKILAGAAAVLALAPMSRADFQYQQTTTMKGGMMNTLAKFGGKSLTEPQVSTVAIKGNRMAHVSKHTAQITDLDKETVTHVDFDKKTYDVMTFAEMRQVMEAARAKMSEQGSDATFNVSIRDTGKTENVNGFNARDFILTLELGAKDRKSGEQGAMNVTSDMWMATDIPGYQEMQKYHQRMAEKLGAGWNGQNAFGGMQAGMGKSFSEMAKEAAKMKGVPVRQVMRMGATSNGAALPAASEVPNLGQSTQAGNSSGDDAAARAAEGAARGASNSATSEAIGQTRRIGGIGGAIASGAAGGLAGGLGGFGRKKKPAEQPARAAEAPAQSQPAQGAMLLTEILMESSGFSTSADASNFEVPAGFKKVPSAFEKMK